MGEKSTTGQQWSDLVERANKNDQAAITELYNQTYSQGYSVALQMVKNEDDAMDVLQDAYVSAFKNISSLKEPEKFKSWFNCIVANRCRDYLRKHKDVVFSDIQVEEDIEFEDTLESDSIEFSPEHAVDYSETKRLMQEILDTLSEEQRLAILMFYYNELSVKEIANTLNCSENTIKSRLNYARAKIKEEVKALEKKGTKLYNIAPIPFIIWMLRGEEKGRKIPLWKFSKNAAFKALFTKGLDTTVKIGSNMVIRNIVIGILSVSLLAGGTYAVTKILTDGGSNPIDAITDEVEGVVEKDVFDSNVEEDDKGIIEDGTTIDGVPEDGIAEDGTTEDGTVDDETTEDGTTNDGIVDDETMGDATTDDGIIEDGTAGDGTTEDGAVEDGTTGDGTTEDGAVEDGTTGDGTTDDGTIEDGTTGDETTDDGTIEDGTTGDETTDDGTVEDGTTGDGTTDDGTVEDGTTEDATKGSQDNPYQIGETIVGEGVYGNGNEPVNVSFTINDVYTFDEALSLAGGTYSSSLEMPLMEITYQVDGTEGDEHNGLHVSMFAVNSDESVSKDVMFLWENVDGFIQNNTTYSLRLHTTYPAEDTNYAFLRMAFYDPETATAQDYFYIALN